MWAVGCMIGEILTGKPLFPGTSTLNQLERIINFTNIPSKSDIESIRSSFANTMLDSVIKKHAAKRRSSEGKRLVSGRMRRASGSGSALVAAATPADKSPQPEETRIDRLIREWFPGADPKAVDLMDSLLQFNPEKRLTAHQALRHPYLAQFHNEKDEPPSDRNFVISIDDNKKFRF
jgi:mitogen-activated protein kinase 15